MAQKVSEKWSEMCVHQRYKITFPNINTTEMLWLSCGWTLEDASDFLGVGNRSFPVSADDVNIWDRSRGGIRHPVEDSLRYDVERGEVVWEQVVWVLQLLLLCQSRWPVVQTGRRSETFLIVHHIFIHCEAFPAPFRPVLFRVSLIIILVPLRFSIYPSNSNVNRTHSLLIDLSPFPSLALNIVTFLVYS